MATSEEFAVNSYHVFREYFEMTPVKIIQLMYRIKQLSNISRAFVYKRYDRNQSSVLQKGKIMKRRIGRRLFLTGKANSTRPEARF
jgi:hypothetical protein